MLTHKVRWIARKIAQRLQLAEAAVYRRRVDLPPMALLALPDPQTPPPLGDTSGDWQTIQPYSYWGHRDLNFLMRSTFTVPADWPADVPVALYLPLGESGDFSHQETLAYIDGQPYAAGDRHHQEIVLPPQWRDGQPHRLELHGWTGLMDADRGEPGVQLKMRPCAVVQIDQPTRDFLVTARVALGIVNAIDEQEPARGLLLNALDAAFGVLDLRAPIGDAFYASGPAAHAALLEGVAKAGRPLDVSIVASGHAHIDVA
ncbi:MAG: alpha-mannosidase, partial [Caldilineaceae bacterium]|nr:alpha-mannosidase [Caldilineaceae bacterium]